MLDSPKPRGFSCWSLPIPTTSMPTYAGRFEEVDGGPLRMQNTIDVEIEKKHVFYEIRKPSCVIGYVYTYILISLHKSTFFLKIQVC